MDDCSEVRQALDLYEENRKKLRTPDEIDDSEADFLRNYGEHYAQCVKCQKFHKILQKSRRP